MSSVDRQQDLPRVDQNEIRTNQVLTVLVLLGAYLTGVEQLVLFQSIVFLMTTIAPSFGPYVLFYRYVLSPLGIIKPDHRVDHAEAHRFATLIGFGVSAAAYGLMVNHAAIAWFLVWLMIVLGILAFAGWCAGCFSYYMLNRLGLKGFFKQTPLNNTFPGQRPANNYVSTE